MVDKKPESKIDNSLAYILYQNFKNFKGTIVDIVDNKLRRKATISARARIVKPEGANNDPKLP